MADFILECILLSLRFVLGPCLLPGQLFLLSPRSITSRKQQRTAWKIGILDVSSMYGGYETNKQTLEHQEGGDDNQTGISVKTGKVFLTPLLNKSGKGACHRTRL